VEVETTPPQPDEVEAAIARALVEAPAEPDPWWQAGIDEALAQEE
jgi:hypothetical protein